MASIREGSLLTLSLWIYAAVWHHPIAGEVMERLGCFKENESARVLPFRAYYGENLTIERCVGLCLNENYAYAGLQYKRHCWCGNSEDYGKYGAAEGCNEPCTGNRSQICGGYFRSSIYKTGFRNDVQTSEATRRQESNAISISPASTKGFTEKRDNGMAGLYIGSTLAACAGFAGVVVLVVILLRKRKKSSSASPTCKCQSSDVSQANKNMNAGAYMTMERVASDAEAAQKANLIDTMPAIKQRQASTTSNDKVGNLPQNYQNYQIEPVYSLAEPIENDLVVVDNDLYGT